MTRSSWKIPFIDKGLLKKISVKRRKKLTWSRRSTLYPATIGLELFIHNGKEMIKRKISQEMIGHKLGELVPTRKGFVPKKKVKRKKRKK